MVEASASGEGGYEVPVGMCGSWKQPLTPYFDRLVRRSGHDLAPIWRKVHRPDGAAVRVGLFSQEIQRICEESQEASV